MPNGYNGKILRVNLSNSTITVDEPGDSFYRQYLGGRGFIAHYLVNEVSPGVDPLGPDNKLIFATGVFTGAPVAGSGRNSVGAKSPLTGGYGEAEAGGFWGPELKRAGYDAIIFEGKAPSPVYLYVNEGQAELRDARGLWGKTTGETLDAISAEVGDKRVRVTAIGPAGENLVRVACVINDVSHAYGRTGMGAVMGSKNLKAVAVRGGKPIPMADAEKVQSFAKWMAETGMERSAGMKDTGTAGILMSLERGGGLPTRNFQEGTFESAEKITGQVIRDTILVNRGSCFACPIHCKREVEVHGRYEVNPIYGGPEYETLASFGSNCGIDDLEALAKASELCNAYSLDTIGTGAIVAFAMECFENGLITEKDTGGLKLNFGNAEAMVQLVEMIARRQGIGNLLAEGTMRAAKAIGKGAERYALHVKGQEFPMHEPRYKAGLGVYYAVSPTGADHCGAAHDTMYERAGPPLNAAMALLGPLEPISSLDIGTQKMRMVTAQNHLQSMKNCIDICIFIPFDLNQTTELIGAVTGWNVSLLELVKAGERATTLTRVFNVRQGFGADHDYLPERMFTAHTKGPNADKPLDRKAVDNAIKLYYGIMGWDEDTGVPTKGKLRELGIEWAIDFLPA